MARRRTEPFEVPCAKCGEIIERSIGVFSDLKFVCYNCKNQRKKENAKKYAREKRKLKIK